MAGSQRILIAYDGSEPAQAAIAAAGRLFPAADAKVVFVYDRPPSPGRVLAAGAILSEEMMRSFAELEQEAAATVEEGRTLAEEAGLTVDASIIRTVGIPWPNILAAADEFDADMIVSGTRGRGRVGRALLGSTSSSLLHQSDRPILIVPERFDEDGPVLIAYDGSDAARLAVQEAARLLPGREAVVAHVWDWPLTDTLTEKALLTTPMVAASEMVDLLKGAAEDVAQNVVEEGRSLAEQHGLKARSQLVEAYDGVWRGLAKAAENSGASVLVAGSRGRGGVKSALLGSVSTALAHNAERPTLVVRPPD